MSPNRPQTFVALLRGINVGGKNKLPMAELRSICTEIECQRVQTYIQSGNVVLVSRATAEALETNLEKAIKKRSDLTVPVIVRKASAWNRYLGSNPFLAEAESEAKWVLLCLSKQAPKAAAAKDLQQRATQGERVAKKGGAIWIHYANGIGRSKLTPAVLDRCVGSPATARNWKTVLQIGDLVRDRTDL